MPVRRNGVGKPIRVRLRVWTHGRYTEEERLTRMNGLVQHPHGLVGYQISRVVVWVVLDIIVVSLHRRVVVDVRVWLNEDL